MKMIENLSVPLLEKNPLELFAGLPIQESEIIASFSQHLCFEQSRTLQHMWGGARGCGLFIMRAWL